MSKTVFQDGDKSTGVPGTRVMAAWLNKIFGREGHRHDGLDDDGHAPLDYAVDTGTVNNYAISLTPALTAHVIGMPIYFKAANANTGASTVNINGLGAVPVLKNINEPLQSGDISGGEIVILFYDGANYRLHHRKNAETLQSYAPSQEPGANQIPVLDASGKLAGGIVPLSRMGTVVANGSVTLAGGASADIALSPVEQMHHFYLLSAFSNSSNTGIAYGADITPNGGNTGAIAASLHTYIYRPTAGNNDVLRIVNIHSTESRTVYYKVYRLTEN